MTSISKCRKLTTNLSEYHNDGISRCYSYTGKKRFVQWFNSCSDGLTNVPEVALCDEVFIANEPDYQDKRYVINLLEVGESCIVEEDICIITRVKQYVTGEF